MGSESWKEYNLQESFDNPNTGLHEANLTIEQEQHLKSSLVETLQIQNTNDSLTELTATPTFTVQDLMGSITETPNLVEAKEPTLDLTTLTFSTCESATVSPLVFGDPNPVFLPVPNYSAPLLNETQSSHPLSFVEGMNMEETISSMQNQDNMTQLGYFNQFSQMQNENFFSFEGIDISNEYNASNPPFIPNIIENNNFDEHNPSNLPLIPNIIENNNFDGINYPSSSYLAFFHPNTVETRSENEIGHSNQQLIENQIPLLSPLQNHITNFDAGWNSRSPQSFTTQLNQVDYTSMQPLYLMYPMSQPYLPLQYAFATMPTSLYEYGYSIVSECATPSAPSLLTNNHQPSLFGITNNSFDSGGSSLPVWSQGVLDQNTEFNPWMNTSNFQQQSLTLHDPRALSSSFASSQALSSTILGPLDTRTSEGISSQVLSVNQMATDGITTLTDEEKLPESSSTRTQPSEAIRRILNMNPSRTVTHNIQPNRNVSNENGRAAYIYEFGKQPAQYEPPRRGRPPKRRETIGESSSQHGKLQKVSSETKETETNQETQKTHDSVVENNDQNTNPSAPSQFQNNVNDPKFGSDDVLLDPHLGLFKSLSEK